MEFITYKIILSFKFVLLYQFSSTLFLAFRGGRGVFGLLDYIFVMLFIVFRYLVLVVSFFLLPFVFVYFAISLILWGEVKLGFSDRYIDESRFILILYTLFLKIPLAGSKYCAYYLLRAVLAGGKNRHGVSLKGFLNNLIFSNLFGSPKWVLELALTFSSDFYYVLGLDLSTKTGLFVRYNLLVESINSNLRTKCRYYVSKCNESRIYTTADGIIFNMYSFLSTSYKNVIKKPILEAVTISGKGEFKRHPLIDSNYSGGTSDGIIKSHTPLKPQSSIQFKKDDGDVDNGVINNLQSKDALGVKPN